MIISAMVVIFFLASGVMMYSTSQYINSDSEYVAHLPVETPNSSTTAVTGDYISVDDALRALTVFSLSPVMKSNTSQFSDVVDSPVVGFDTLSNDPRPGVWETSEYMVGEVGVYIIFVESNGQIDMDLFDWSENSINWAKNGIIKALAWWKSQYPFRNPSLEFYINVETVIGYTGYEPMLRSKDDHKLWVPDVLERLGCGYGSNNWEIGKRCAHTIRQNWNTDWAFIIFVVNAGATSPSWGSIRAFAYKNGPYVVLPFGWFYHLMFEGTDGLASVVAHEIGHIFGASDEYNGKPELSGYLYEPDNDGSDCIMDSGRWCISHGTKRQIGWVDDNYNGYPDVLENRPSIILLNNLSSVTDSEEIVIEGVFRLEPYPCRRPNCRPVTINAVIPINATGVITALDGSFDTAYEPFSLIYWPGSSGYHTISIVIMDSLVGNIESYSKDVLYTYLEVQSVETSSTVKRVDVGTPVPIRFKVVLAHDKRPLESGKIFVEGFEATPLGDGWYEVTVFSDRVGRYLYQPTSAEVTLYTELGSGRLTNIKLNGAKPLEVVYDRIVVWVVATRNRVDVGSEASITVQARYEYDGQPFVGDVILSNNRLQYIVGSYTYKAVKVVDRLYGLQAFITNEVNVIFDKVRIQLTALRERVDVGSEAPITVQAWYEYDKTPFQGDIYLNEPLRYDTVSLVRYHASHIYDRLYGLRTFESNDVHVVFDKVIVTLGCNLKRIDVGSEAPIEINARYAFDSTPFIGRVYLSTDKEQDNVGLYKYYVTKIEDELYGLKVFETNEIEIVFDTVVIELESINERVEVGKMAAISYKAYYSYDGSPFEGEVFLNNELAFHEVGQVSYTVSRIIDRKYGLTSFSSNSVRVIFDYARTVLEVDTTTPFTVKAVLRTYYESDGSPVTSGTLMIGDKRSYSEEDQPGTYLVSYPEMLPLTRLTGIFAIEGFDEIKIDKATVHVGNIIVYIPVLITILALIAQRGTKGKKSKITVCLRCGSTNYIGIRVASNKWEYECQSCGVRWYVKKR